MHRCFPLAVFLVLSLLPATLPARAQQTDTTGAAPTADDTARTASADTAAVDTTMTADAPLADTTQASTAPDTLAADSAAATDTAAVDTALSAAARRERAKEQARATAEAWLSLIDDGQFGASWDEAAASLQRSISREAWQKRGARVRGTLKSPADRELARAMYRDSTAQVPGTSPVVALQYRTAFAGRSTLEAVIIQKQAANWKVAGYRVVPAPADSVQAPTDSAPPPDPTQAPLEPDSTQNPSEPDSTQDR